MNAFFYCGQEDVAARSQTVWYTDKVETNGSNTECDSAEEAVSYSTSIVGGVVVKTPIQSK